MAEAGAAGVVVVGPLAGLGGACVVGMGRQGVVAGGGAEAGTGTGVTTNQGLGRVGLGWCVIRGVGWMGTSIVL